jgi:hypothetical protein
VLDRFSWARFQPETRPSWSVKSLNSLRAFMYIGRRFTNTPS